MQHAPVARVILLCHTLHTTRPCGNGLICTRVRLVVFIYMVMLAGLSGWPAGWVSKYSTTVRRTFPWGPCWMLDSGTWGGDWVIAGTCLPPPFLTPFIQTHFVIITTTASLSNSIFYLAFSLSHLLSLFPHPPLHQPFSPPPPHSHPLNRPLSTRQRPKSSLVSLDQSRPRPN